ncbi:MAG: hypothetical protein ACWA7D_00065 [Pseudomonas asiatica]
MIKSVLTTIWPSLESVLNTHEENMANALPHLQKLCLSCKCGALAIPIPGTADRYRCRKETCGRQFISATHNIETELSDRYGAAVVKDYGELVKGLR